MKRVMVVGATGTIGRRVVEILKQAYEVVTVGHSSGEHHLDLASKQSIEAVYREIQEVDHVVSAAGVAEFAPLEELTDEDFELSLSNKLMGQINLVRLGLQYVDGGSFTLTSGVLARQPIKGSAAISTVNAGIEGFARAAALELEGRARVNVVSPGWVSETLEEMGRDPANGVPAAEVAAAYRESVEGAQTGEVFEVLPS
jgi:NAD(P)-dependent dehydrogenase (short-subunit alcohol dehydrogenase family)